MTQNVTSNEQCVTPQAPFLNPLLAPVKVILDAHPAGLSEYELISHLRIHCEWIPAHWATDSLGLYRLHCLLFNALYQWQQEWLRSENIYLQVSALKIGKMPAQQRTRPGLSGALTDAVDAKLAAFYLDWEQWADTDRDEVEALLQSFWTRYLQDGRSGDCQQRQSALATLNLQDPVTPVEIKQAYRRLISRHHPDRGGDTAYVQTLNEAVSILLAP